VKIRIEKEDVASYIAGTGDSEWITDKECVLDLYDIEPPVTMDLVFAKGGAFVDGAYKMAYDEEEGGWYMAEEITDKETVLRALADAGVIPA